jgi:ubiquinone/menaquinone biosynthesis C-methylase UbiE
LIPGTSFLIANAEAIPVADASCDAVTSIFMFHELPPSVRRAVFRECTRVLKPGGRFVLVDSVQRGDRPDYDGLLDLFPQNYHEPYYSTYITENFQEIGRASGLTHVRSFNAFVSKVMVFDKPGSRVSGVPQSPQTSKAPGLASLR